MRVLLLIATNFAVMLLVGVVFAVLQGMGVLPQGPWMQMLVWCALLGFGGSFVSLLLSKTIAKWSTRAQVIEHPRTEVEVWLVEAVRRHARKADIGMPEVAVFDSPDPNAFATGATKNSSLVAVSTGLLAAMDRKQVEAVLGHEISHIANGDMVTLTLIQGVLNTFVFFLARVIGSVVDGSVLRGKGRGIGYFVTVMAAQVVLGLLASMIVMWFSRRREFRADAGGAALTSPADMASALGQLQHIHSPTALPKTLAAFGIHGGDVASLFRSHPPLEHRIARLQTM